MRSSSRRQESGEDGGGQNESTVKRSKRARWMRGTNEAVAMMGVRQQGNRAEEQQLEAAATRVRVGLVKTEKAIDVRDVCIWVEAI